MEKTMEYYQKNAEEFITSTENCDMSRFYNMFEQYLPISGKILDLGFGSGRDSLYFLKHYDVVSLDPCEEFCVHGKKIGLKTILCEKAEDMNFKDEFDGIWACASLLHLSPNHLQEVFIKCSDALKENGVMYVSFKYGHFEGIRKGRYYLDLTIKDLKEYLSQTKLVLQDFDVSKDVRKERTELWVNAILFKK